MATITGIDEVGRGSWAGPLLVVAARAKTTLPDGLADSKVLTKKMRELLCEAIMLTCDLGEGWVQPEEIDRIGLARSLRLGVARALLELGTLSDDPVIIDGLVNYCPNEFINAKAVIRADSTQPIVSAASIYAKVQRDRHMERLAQFYPEYKFEKHVGYGTKLHRELLQLHGASKVHRHSYKPVRSLTKAA